MNQVHEAAAAGKFIEAQAMMDKVLAAHPNSAKAHFIDAELLAKQGKFERARTELATAERLAPGLPFAKRGGGGEAARGAGADQGEHRAGGRGACAVAPGPA